MDHFIARRFHCSCWQIFGHMPSLTFRIIIGVELFIRVAATAISGPIPCSPYITNPKNGKCYRKYCDLQEAASASEMCRYMGGQLVTICDKDDNDLIAGLAILHPDHLDALNSVWIGLMNTQQGVVHFTHIPSRCTCRSQELHCEKNCFGAIQPYAFYDFTNNYQCPDTD
nr:unnamed protein product [Haemonchus contortus]